MNGIFSLPQQMADATPTVDMLSADFDAYLLHQWIRTPLNLAAVAIVAYEASWL
jgi:hypothetical protein